MKRFQATTLICSFLITNQKNIPKRNIKGALPSTYFCEVTCTKLIFTAIILVSADMLRNNCLYAAI